MQKTHRIDASDCLLTGFNPDDRHHVKQDFGVLLSQNSTDKETNNGYVLLHFTIPSYD